MKLNGWFHAPANVPLRKEPLIPIEKEAKKAPAYPGCFREESNLLPVPGKK
jgi:hypothetical protein